MQPDPEPQPPTPAPPARALRISDADRERTAAVLERATGEGRLTLEEFSVRIGAVWAARDSTELAHTTADLTPVAPAVVGATQPAENIVNIFASSKRHGRWRLPRRMNVSNVFGDVELDLRDAEIGSEAFADNAVDITGKNVFGSVKVIVPEGVEVELTGKLIFGERKSQLAPVQRLAGTPVIRVNISTVFGETKVESRGPNSGSALARWARGLLDR